MEDVRFCKMKVQEYSGLDIEHPNDRCHEQRSLTVWRSAVVLAAGRSIPHTPQTGCMEADGHQNTRPVNKENNHNNATRA